MFFFKQFFPEELPSGTPKKPTKKRATPDADADFRTLAENVSKKWLVSPKITLVWKTPDEFAIEVAAYGTSLSATKKAGGQRMAQTNELELLDEKIEEAVDEVQAYLRKKFKKNDRANYGRYGIVKENKTYQFPKDRDERKESLLLMKDAIADDGFGSEEYGTTFWTTMITDYTKAFDATKATDGSKSTSVGAKNVTKAAIRKVLVSLHHIVVGNYPDTYKEEVRAWGWQKEDY